VLRDFRGVALSEESTWFGAWFAVTLSHTCVIVLQSGNFHIRGCLWEEIPETNISGTLTFDAVNKIFTTHLFILPLHDYTLQFVSIYSFIIHLRETHRVALISAFQVLAYATLCTHPRVTKAILASNVL
jgi:hypothetical protein